MASVPLPTIEQMVSEAQTLQEGSELFVQAYADVHDELVAISKRVKHLRRSLRDSARELQRGVEHLDKAVGKYRHDWYPPDIEPGDALGEFADAVAFALSELPRPRKVRDELLGPHFNSAGGPTMTAFASGLEDKLRALDDEDDDDTYDDGEEE
jgi:hypothetical protein